MGVNIISDLQMSWKTMYPVRCFLILQIFSVFRSILSSPFELKPASSSNDANRSRIFSPRMDYDEWTPLGRGDPLKNDPTFDYVPPVLDRVQYWLDSQSSTEASSKRDILVLGVTAKKTSPKIPEHFLKFVDAPKFNRNQQETINFRKDFTGSTGAEPPKIVRTTKFRAGNPGNSLDFRNQNRIQPIPASYYPSPYYAEKPKPFTMMMPPPMIKPEVTHQYGVQTEETPSISLLRPDVTRDHLSGSGSALIAQGISKGVEQSTTSVTFDKSNLVYQSSQTFDPWVTGNVNHDQSVIWNGNADKPVENYDDHQPAASVNHEVVVGQNANIIVDEAEKNEQVVVGKKEIVPPVVNQSISDDSEQQLASSKMHIVLANTSASSVEENNKVTVAVVMPTNYQPTFNDSKEPEESKIVTTTPVPMNVSSVTRVPPWRPPSRPSPSRIFSRRPGVPMITNSNMLRPVQKPVHQPLGPPEVIMMQSMTSNRLPMPSVSMQPMFSSFSLLPSSSAKPMSSEFSSSSPSSSALSPSFASSMGSFHPPGNMIDMIRPTTSVQSPLAMLLDVEEVEKITTTHSSSIQPTTLASTSTTEATVSTPNSRSTTESIFSSFKQPSKPIHGPMYLIIQGHSKVKTYKPTVNKYGVPVEKNVIVESTTRRPISKFEQFVNDNTRVAPTTERSITVNNHEVKAKEKRVEHDSLLSLVESGLSAFTVPPSLQLME